MNTVDTVVIGAGHAGLAVSRLLTEAGRDHVVLDRGRVAERWRTERWDSLHLLTPNWMTRLPGWQHDGADPDGFMSASRFVRYLERYAESFDSPVVGGTTVHELSQASSGDIGVVTDRGTWRARHVVIATGPHGVPHVPAGLDDSRGAHLPTATATPPSSRPVACSWSAPRPPGVQIADELNSRGPRRGPRGRSAHQDAPPLSRHGHLLVAAASPAGSPAPSTRSPTRRPPGASRRCS